MLENIRLAFRGIASHKMRSFLTMLGIIIGIASIMSIVSTIKGTNDALRDKLVGSGNNTVKVSLSSGGQELSIYDASSVSQNIQPIADETRQKIADLKTVKQVTLYNKRFVTDSSVFYGDNSVSQFNMYGVDDVYFDTVGYRLKTGRAFLESDYTLFRKVMILDQVASQKLFPDTDPLGKTVEFMGQPFTVIGVMYEPDDYEPDIQTVEDYYNNQDNSNGLFFIPKADWPIVFNYDEPENVIVRATSTDDMTTAGGAAAKILNQTITSTSDDTPKYQAEDLLGIVKSQQKLTAAANMQLIWIAGISLLVGAIGVMNIMLVSVTERTAEIGLKKAIGARQSAILGQFLTEAAVLTTMGGLIGVGVGVLLSYLINRFSGIPVAISIPWSAGAVLISMLIGVISGLLPAQKAARMDPINALRRE